MATRSDGQCSVQVEKKNIECYIIFRILDEKFKFMGQESSKGQIAVCYASDRSRTNAHDLNIDIDSMEIRFNRRYG